MRTETRRGTPRHPSGAGSLEERLARRFAAELFAADADFPRVVAHGRAAIEPGATTRTGRLPRRRFALPIAAAAVLIVAVLAALLGPWRASVVPGASPSPSVVSGETAQVVLGPDGVPTSVSGEHVFRLGGEGLSDSLARSGGALIAAQGVNAAMRCPAVLPSSADAALEVWAPCGGRMLYDARYYPVSTYSITLPADGRWLVVRAHSHDHRATSCPDSVRDACENAITVDAVVWQNAPRASSIVFDPNGVPTSINGEPVYRPSAVSIVSASSFLLIGVVYEPAPALAACPTGEGSYPIYAPQNPAERILLPATGICDGRSRIELTLGGQSAALGRLGPKLPTGHLVVLRVHTHDPLAEQCDDREACAAVPVPDSIVWDSGSTRVEMGPNGIPSAIGGERVLQSAGEPGTGMPSYLLGGLLDRDEGPTFACIQCTVWHVGDARAKVSIAGVHEQLTKLLGQRVVVRVHRDTSTPPCDGCAPYQIVIDAVVWSSAAASLTPSPPVTRAPATPAPTLPNGIPTSVGGEPVVAPNAPSVGSTYLTGGTLDAEPVGFSCPFGGSCTTWYVHPYNVSMEASLEVERSLHPLVGKLVVLRVHRTPNPCTDCGRTYVIVIDAVVWSESKGAG